MKFELVGKQSVISYKIEKKRHDIELNQGPQ
jgi:hypothetical protein